MKTHRLFGFIVLGLVFAARVYADGTYQRTDDRKRTFVWNNDPQPGDTATWTGDRDAAGYATGPGTLTWSRVNRGFSTGSNVATMRKRTPISSYSGTMVRGKFDGAVTTVDRGKSYHAKFVDGQRKGNWAAGPAIAKAESVEAAPVAEKAEHAETAKSTAVATEEATTEKVAEEKKAPSPPVAEQTTEDIPAAGPAEEKTEVASQKPEANNSTAVESSKPATPLIAQASITQPDESATPRQPITRKAALAPGAVRAIERPTAASPKKTESTTAKKATPAKTSEEKAEKSAKTTKPAPSQPIEAETSEDIPAAGPSTAAKEKIEPPILKSEHPISAQPSTKTTPPDDSIRSLTGPPSSLRTKTEPLPETNPPTEIPAAPSAALSPSAVAAAKLTPVQAMDIADIEARTRGFDLGEYQLPKAEYNGANDTWSVGYVGRGADGSEKRLSVVVQDKSGKAEVKK